MNSTSFYHNASFQHQFPSEMGYHSSMAPCFAHPGAPFGRGPFGGDPQGLFGSGICGLPIPPPHLSMPGFSFGRGRGSFGLGFCGRPGMEYSMFNRGHHHGCFSRGRGGFMGHGITGHPGHFPFAGDFEPFDVPRRDLHDYANADFSESRPSFGEVLCNCGCGACSESRKKPRESENSERKGLNLPHQRGGHNGHSHGRRNDDECKGRKNDNERNEHAARDPACCNDGEHVTRAGPMGDYLGPHRSPHMHHPHGHHPIYSGRGIRGGLFRSRGSSGRGGRGHLRGRGVNYHTFFERNFEADETDEENISKNEAAGDAEQASHADQFEDDNEIVEVVESASTPVTISEGDSEETAGKGNTDKKDDGKGKGKETNNSE